MVYTGTICTEAEISLFVGQDVNGTGNTEANRNLLVAQAESYLSCVMRYNVVDNFGSLNNDVRRILSEYGARYAAVGLISFQLDGYTSRVAAENLLNIHLYRMRVIERFIMDQNVASYLKGQDE